MALIHCSDCGHEISDGAKSCPNCGGPIAKAEKRQKKSKRLIVSLSVLVCVAICAIAFALFTFFNASQKTDIHRFAAVKLGMSKDTVLSLVGEPWDQDDPMWGYETTVLKRDAFYGINFDESGSVSSLILTFPGMISMDSKTKAYNDYLSFVDDISSAVECRPSYPEHHWEGEISRWEYHGETFILALKQDDDETYTITMQFYI